MSDLKDAQQHTPFTEAFLGSYGKKCRCCDILGKCYYVTFLALNKPELIWIWVAGICIPIVSITNLKSLNIFFGKDWSFEVEPDSHGVTQTGLEPLLSLLPHPTEFTGTSNPPQEKLDFLKFFIKTIELYSFILLYSWLKLGMGNLGPPT